MALIDMMTRAGV